jgi:LacI family transcriptional regulator
MTTSSRSRSRVGIADVAAEAGVAVVTVSRVLNGARYVHPKTKILVENAMRMLGYQPSATARSMRTNVTHTIGFLLPDLTNTVNAQIAQAAEESLHKAGYFMLLGSSRFDLTSEIDFLRILSQRRVDGMILQPSDDTNPKLHELVRDSNVPVVLIDRDFPFDVDCILNDHYHAARQAAEYLIGLGHRRIAIITSRLTTRAGRERVAAYRDALTAAGIPLRPYFICHEHQVEEYARREAYALLSHTDRPTAIIAAGNQILYGVLEAIKLMELRVPEDLSVIGADEAVLSGIFNPSITVIARDVAALGRGAAELLISRIVGQSDNRPRRLILRSEIILRSSCGPPPKE